MAELAPRERLQPSEDALRRQSIRAPVAGRVLGLRIHTEGAAIGDRTGQRDRPVEPGARFLDEGQRRDGAGMTASARRNQN